MLIPLLLTVSAAAQDADFEDESVAATQGEADIETEIAGGMASYYGRELAGNRTASGERFDPGQLTAAHRTLPFGSLVRVTNVSNGDSVVVRINDRGPFHGGRVIDVSHAAAREIGMHRSGTA
ncbi:MAG TPA: septal ring lytic transglycosylase RlpA family protein, partial [Sphingopyxis sp.]|nr:septal ring lytic transglycosylase RlpA family protein [Sphingopyxis sp.]